MIIYQGNYMLVLISEELLYYAQGNEVNQIGKKILVYLSINIRV